jgi:hypothetical protein
MLWVSFTEVFPDSTKHLIADGFNDTAALSISTACVFASIPIYLALDLLVRFIVRRSYEEGAVAAPLTAATAAARCAPDALQLAELAAAAERARSGAKPAAADPEELSKLEAGDCGCCTAAGGTTQSPTSLEASAAGRCCLPAGPECAVESAVAMIQADADEFREMSHTGLMAALAVALHKCASLREPCVCLTSFLGGVAGGVLRSGGIVVGGVVVGGSRAAQTARRAQGMRRACTERKVGGGRVQRRGVCAGLRA